MCSITNVRLLLFISIMLTFGSVLAENCKQSAEKFSTDPTGTITDKATGLQWMRCTLGFMWDGNHCIEGKQWYTWFQWKRALNLAKQNGFAGYQDWRLPTIDELETLLKTTCGGDKSSTISILANVPGRYWTQTEDKENNQYVWVVNFKNGRSTTQLKSSASYYVRLVRGKIWTPLVEEPVKFLWDELEHDGIHDPSNPDLALLQRPSDAFEKLDRSYRKSIDWVKSENKHKISPRNTVQGDKEDEPFNFDIVMANTKTMPYVVFKHSIHTKWLTCSNCHPDIFYPKVNSNKISMEDILQGKQCGRCHGRVAFSLYECERCHSILHKDSPKAWWTDKKHRPSP